MKLIRSENFSKEVVSGSVLTIGNYDGLHQGHRRIISELTKKANELGVASVVYTFEPHPVRVLAPEKAHSSLFQREDLQVELEKLGVNYLFIRKFDRAFSEVSPEDFFSLELKKRFQPKQVIVGPDFRFGKTRSGGNSLLEKLCVQSQIHFEVIPFVEIEGRRVSSSQIRQVLSSGEIQLANKMLGRNYYMLGRSIHGDGRGRQLTVSTINMLPYSEVIPKFGVYVTKIELNSSQYVSVTNVGVNPTFSKSKLLESSVSGAKFKIETHILADNINTSEGVDLKLFYFARIRDEIKFESVSELKDQIEKDIIFTKDYFK